MSVLSELAEQIYDTELGFGETGTARQTEVDLVEAWLGAHLGEFNALTHSNYSLSNLSLFYQEESAIMREMYLIHYYKKRGRLLLRMVDGSGGELDFQTIREGDSVITRTNKNEAARNYRLLTELAQQSLNDLVSLYNMYRAPPRQITGDDADA
jgi:hypothetical protein